jgi:superfamily II DNA or RNA helicase
MYELRPYQKEASAKIMQQWEHGVRRTLLVLPTGCGKTVVFSDVVKKATKDGSRALVLAHRQELLDQASDKLLSAFGIRTSLEKAEHSSLGSKELVTVGSIQSLAQPKRLAQFPADYFKTIIVDEAHHCLSESYKRVLDHFDSNVLGVTATPDRGDKKSLGQFFETEAYEYSMRSAIKDGYLVPIKAQMIPIQLDIENVKISNGDFQAGDIGEALEPYLEEIAREMANYCKGRKTVVFLPLISTSQKFRDMLEAVGFKAAEVNGTSKDREEILADFAAGKYDVLCNSMLLTEGWDCPSVDCVVVLRPTKVRALYQQMVGRGMRLHPGKDHLLLLDFLWMTARHDLCKPSSLVCKTAEIAEQMDQNLKADDEPHDILEAEEQAERDVVAERERALARQLEEQRRMKRKLVDPLQYSISIGADDLADYEPTYAWENEPPTEKQLAALEKWGIFSGDVKNKGFACMLMDRLVQRREAGLATPKQIRCLERYGFRNVGKWMFGTATKMIGKLAARNWILPPDFDPTWYVPRELMADGGDVNG